MKIKKKSSTIFESKNRITELKENFIRYKNKTYSAKDFKLYELKYSSAFNKREIHRVYGAGSSFELTRKYANVISGKLEIDSTTYPISKQQFERFENKLKEYAFWDIQDYKSGSPCLDGTVISISGIRANDLLGLVSLSSTNCAKKMELPIQLERIFRNEFVMKN